MSFAVEAACRPGQRGTTVPHVLPFGLRERAFYDSGPGPAR
jgi:hypothetical protein